MAVLLYITNYVIYESHDLFWEKHKRTNPTKKERDYTFFFCKNTLKNA